MAKRIVKFNDKYYDIGTANKSFLKVAIDLKKAGVKNWYFMLEIQDLTLINVNPHQVDPKTEKCTLSKDIIQRVIYECKNNCWYFLREVCRIPEAGSPSGVSYRANRGNIAQAWCLLHGIDSWLCLTRQQGKTISMVAMLNWVFNYGTQNSTFIFINKDGDAAKENLNRLGQQIDILPEYMRFKAALVDDSDEKNPKVVKAVRNATKMVHPVTRNQIIVKSKATSYNTALSIARGLTAPILYFDEPEFTDHIKTIVDNSVSTFNTAAERSKKNHTMYGRIFTCTPGDLDTQPGQQSQKILDKTRKWTEKMYDWSIQKCMEYLKADDSNHIIYIEYDYHQIGKTEEWFVNIANEINDPITVRREILLQRLKGSGNSPYSREDIDAIIDLQQKPLGSFFLQEYFEVFYYEELKKRTPYIIGVDCSTGTLGDNNSISIINPYTCKLAAEFECSFIGETMYEALIKELIMKHLPKGIVCIERNSVGDGIIDHLLYTPIAKNIYFDRNKDLMAETMSDNEDVSISMLKNKAAQKTFYGVYTNGNSRETMFAILSNHVNNKKESFVGQYVTRDLSRLIKKASGKIEAASGFHDDAIMSFLIALYVFYHGNNLPMFGFERGAEEISNRNQGLNIPLKEIPVESLDIGESAKSQLLAQQIKEKNTAIYEDMLRKAVLESQREEMHRQNTSVNINNIYSDTPNYLIENDEDTTGSLPMSFFNELNGIM